MINSSNEYIKTNIESHFYVGQKLRIKRSFVEDDNESYPTYLKDLNNKGIFVDLPTKHGTNIPLYKNKQIEITYISKEGIWLGSSKVIEVITSGMSGAWLSYPKLLEKVQRREYMRWDLKFSVKIFVFFSEENLDKPEEIITAELKNISGGGIAVLTRQKLPLDKALYVNIDAEGVFVFCKIKFIHEQFDIFTKKLITGYQYIDVDNKVVDKIHKLGLNDQLEMRRKGLI